MIMKLLSQLRYIKSVKNIYRLLTCKIRSMELAITYCCNYRCSGCYVGTLKEDITLSYEEACKIIDKYNPAAINFTGGEPLLHHQIIPLIKYASNKGIIVSMVTNGSLLSFTKLKELSEAGLNTIQISYGSNYPKENLGWSIVAKAHGLNVCLSVTNTFKNKEWILKALKHAKMYGIHVLWNLPGGELEKEFDKETYFKYRNLPYVREDNMFWKKRNECPAGVQKIYVSARGELYPCDRLHEKYDSYEEMSKVYKAKKKVWCNRLGNIQND